MAEYEALCNQPLADENEVIPRMVVLEDFIVGSQPTTLAEAVILLMHGTDQINRGNASDDAADQVELREYTVRRATRFLARELRVDLGQFGGSYYAAEYLVPSLQGRADV